MMLIFFLVYVYQLSPLARASACAVSDSGVVRTGAVFPPEKGCLHHRWRCIFSFETMTLKFKGKISGGFLCFAMNGSDQAYRNRLIVLWDRHWSMIYHLWSSMIKKIASIWNIYIPYENHSQWTNESRTNNSDLGPGTFLVNPMPHSSKFGGLGHHMSPPKRVPGWPQRCRSWLNF